MGLEITKKDYTEEDFDNFHWSLMKETMKINDLLKSGNTIPEKKVGIEIEGWFSEENNPSVKGEVALDKLSNHYVVPEIAKFNFEINSKAFDLNRFAFQKLGENVYSSYRNLYDIAKKEGLELLFIGSMPTLCEKHLELKNMSSRQRYFYLNDYIMGKNNKININIEGDDHLDIYRDNVLSESAATSLQIHLGVEPELSHHYYNASIIASSIMAAVGANSPFLFGKELWHETRIANFEESVQLNSSCEKKLKRVTLGGRFSRDITDLFWENIKSFPVIMPETQSSNINDLSHLNLHNGTIWRWNRPIVTIQDGKIATRIEHRVASSGPTFNDMMANVVLYILLTESLVDRIVDMDYFDDYQTHENNFYKASKQGLEANIKWINGNTYTFKDLFIKEIYPMISKKYTSLNISSDDFKNYIDEIIMPRVTGGQNGAKWQKMHYNKFKSFELLINDYIKNQKTNMPVHTWEL